MREAITQYGCPKIFNTDQGCQFTSQEFTGLLKDHGIQIGMDGRGCQAPLMNKQNLSNQAEPPLSSWLRYSGFEKPLNLYPNSVLQSYFNEI